MPAPSIDLSALMGWQNSQLETLTNDIRRLMAKFEDFQAHLANLEVKVIEHLALEMATEAENDNLKKQIADLQDKLAHSALSDVEAQQVLDKIAAMEAKLAPPPPPAI